eukprot:483067-Hanusia_phi.AAC.1
MGPSLARTRHAPPTCLLLLSPARRSLLPCRPDLSAHPWSSLPPLPPLGPLQPLWPHVANRPSRTHQPRLPLLTAEADRAAGTHGPWLAEEDLDGGGEVVHAGRGRPHGVEVHMLLPPPAPHLPRPAPCVCIQGPHLVVELPDLVLQARRQQIRAIRREAAAVNAQPRARPCLLGANEVDADQQN